MSQPSIYWWQKYGTLAQMAQAAVALLGFVAILFQINEIRTNNRSAGARQAYLAYTDLAFKNPQFSQPDYERIKAAGRDEQIQYESFVSYFLYACEEAIDGIRRQARMAGVLRLRPEAASAVPVREERGRAGLSATYSGDTQRWVKASLKTAERHATRLQAGKDLRQ